MDTSEADVTGAVRSTQRDLRGLFWLASVQTIATAVVIVTPERPVSLALWMSVLLALTFFSFAVQKRFAQDLVRAA